MVLHDATGESGPSSLVHDPSICSSTVMLLCLLMHQSQYLLTADVDASCSSLTTQTMIAVFTQDFGTVPSAYLAERVIVRCVPSRVELRFIDNDYYRVNAIDT